MDDLRISLDTAGSKGEITVIRVDGVIDTMTSSELEKVMNSLLEQERFKIIIDLAGVEYISSAGWGIFISNIRDIKGNRGDIKLARMIPSVYEIYELLEFDSILKAYDNIEKAKVEFNIDGNGGNGGNGSKQAAVLTRPAEAEAPSAEVSEAEAAIKTEEYVPTNRPAGAPAKQAEEQQADSSDGGAKNPEQLVLGLIKADPFYSIGELAKMVNSELNGTDQRVGWWGVWKILRRNSLLSKKKRFRYSRR